MLHKSAQSVAFTIQTPSQAEFGLGGRFISPTATLRSGLASWREVVSLDCGIFFFELVRNARLVGEIGGVIVESED